MPTPAEARWEPIVRSARRSGLSMRAYARKHGINEYTLAGWNSRFPAEHAPAAFCEITVADLPSSLRLHVGAVRIEVDRQADLALLRRIVEALS